MALDSEQPRGFRKARLKEVRDRFRLLGPVPFHQIPNPLATVGYLTNMSTAPTTDLSFPIGKFQWTGPNTDADRTGFINEIAELPAKLRAAVAGLTEAQLDTPYRPGGWTVRQTVHHIADSHMNAYIRFKLALTETDPLVKPYAQTEWAELADSKLPAETSLKLIDSLHERWAAVLRAMKPADFDRTLKHPELGTVNLDRYVALYAWHCNHHTAHITELRKREGL